MVRSSLDYVASLWYTLWIIDGARSDGRMRKKTQERREKFWGKILKRYKGWWKGGKEYKNKTEKKKQDMEADCVLVLYDYFVPKLYLVLKTLD